MIKILSKEDHIKFHHRYRNSDLFRQWSGILCELERVAQEIDAITLWFYADKCLARLREIKIYRDEEIPYIFRDMIKDCGAVERNGEKINRHPDKAERSVVTIMCIMLTSLMNAVEEGHEDEDFNNKAMCVAIDRLLHQNSYYQFLMEVFFNRKIGNDGKKVVIKPCDPMNEASILMNMDETEKEEMETMKNKVLNITNGLRVYLKNDWDAWVSIWDEIFLDSDLFTLLTTKNPSDNEWELNEKMICDVIGIFLEKFDYKKHVSKVNNVLAPIKNQRDYISNHGRNGGSSAVFSDEQHTKVENIIISKKSS